MSGLSHNVDLRHQPEAYVFVGGELFFNEAIYVYDGLDSVLWISISRLMFKGIEVVVIRQNFRELWFAAPQTVGGLIHKTDQRVMQVIPVTDGTQFSFHAMDGPVLVTGEVKNVMPGHHLRMQLSMKFEKTP